MASISANSEADRLAQLKAFDATKAGVKGLVDAGVREIPPIFYTPPDIMDNNKSSDDKKFTFPVIDLEGTATDPAKRKEIVEKVRDASSTWGFFQVLNHGVPLNVLEEMKAGVKRFYEQDLDEKTKFFSRDYSTNMMVGTICYEHFEQQLQTIYREILMEYSKEMVKMGYLIIELLSEALGLDPNYLRNKDYHVGGLQVLHQDQWVDITPLPGSLVINIGDLLQVIC
ncbi:unnamed protein product [Linum tenue]|uniref:Uncharacterized protein n=1 Tax=Linum tenue TaxID=586396 RepID=A0AAV0NHM2_9ROSI|nr:unnamed protein product [Linum tenue]